MKIRKITEFESLELKYLVPKHLYIFLKLQNFSLEFIWTSLGMILIKKEKPLIWGIV